MTTLDDAPLTRREFQAFREDLYRQLQHYATKADLAEVKADLAEMKAELIKWMIGLMLASIAAASTIALVAQRLIES